MKHFANHQINKENLLVKKRKLRSIKKKVTFHVGKATFSYIQVAIHSDITTFLILFILLPSHACHSASR